jgi:hypothetical protein
LVHWWLGLGQNYLFSSEILIFLNHHLESPQKQVMH